MGDASGRGEDHFDLVAPGLERGLPTFCDKPIGGTVAGTRRILKLAEDHVETEVALANPGWNTNQPNVLCLLNGRQVGCTPDVDVWEAMLPPQTMVFLPIRLKASPGDRLTLLFLAHDEPKRPFPSSQMQTLYVEHIPAQPPAFVEAPTAPKVLGGCNSVVMLTDPTPAKSYRPPHTHQRGNPLYVLVQACESAGNEYVWFVPIANRTTVIDMPGDVWHAAVRLPDKADLATVVPIDTTQGGALGPVGEFQVAVVPIESAGIQSMLRRYFTDAAAFKD
jgi:hypothetical protein